jgi:hypothetical protein
MGEEEIELLIYTFEETKLRVSHSFQTLPPFLILASRARRVSSEVPAEETPAATGGREEVGVGTEATLTAEEEVKVEATLGAAGDIPKRSFILRNLAEGVRSRFGSMFSEGRGPCVDRGAV